MSAEPLAADPVPMRVVLAERLIREAIAAARARGLRVEAGPAWGVEPDGRGAWRATGGAVSPLGAVLVLIGPDSRIDGLRWAAAEALGGVSLAFVEGIEQGLTASAGPLALRFEGQGIRLERAEGFRLGALLQGEL